MIIFIAAIIASILLAVSTALEPVYIQNVINACMKSDKGGMERNFIIFVFCVLGILLFETVRKICYGKYTVEKTKFLKNGILRKILRMRVEEFQKENGQNYLTLLNKEIDLLVENYYLEALDLVYCILVLITSTVALFYINWILAIIIFVSTILPIWISSILGERIEIRTNVYVKSLEKLNVIIGNLISGYTTVKANRMESKYGALLKQQNQKNVQDKFKETKTETGISMLVAFLFYIGKIALIGASAYMIFKGRTTVGALIGALQISEMLSIPVASIADEIGSIRSVETIRKKIFSMLSDEKEVQKGRVECAPIESIEFQHASFKYGDKYVLKDINLKFEANKKYLILGENGSGKSTLFKLISRFATDYEGSILINEIDLRKLDDSYYEQLGIILQTPFLFNDSLHNNVTLYEDCDEQEVSNILRSLGMDKFLAEHDLQEEYVDTKDNISGGEKQKLSLARVLLKHKKFILLDEATSAIDRESSLVIEKTLLSNPQNTIINVEHKIIEELLPMYDEVYEVKNMGITKVRGR